MDLNEFSRDELLQLRRDIDKAINNYDKRRRAEAMAAAEAAVREMGFTLAELSVGGVGGPKNAPKYRHPEDPDLTWSGRGRKPDWFTSAIESGAKPEEMLIKP